LAFTFLRTSYLLQGSITFAHLLAFINTTTQLWLKPTYAGVKHTNLLQTTQDIFSLLVHFRDSNDELTQ
jgi:hypothetical protein